ncbi:hypothetical protein HMPREF2978_08240 [Corynebacterium sp. HMSC074C01]|nr:hypothetical protein HMPREF2978_08240 [Corynebacterium sp. HMSC074C01]
MALLKSGGAGFALFAAKAGRPEVHLVQAGKLGSIGGRSSERAEFVGCAGYVFHQRNPRVA